MGEMLVPAESNPPDKPAQMSRYRALSTMDKMAYNPVKELIELVQEMKQEENRDKVAEAAIHLKLLPYFSAAQNKAVDVNVQGQQQVIVAPISFDSLYEGKDITPCKPALIDVFASRQLETDENE